MQTYPFSIDVPEIIIQIAAIIQTAGGKAYVVGGMVRDAVIESFHNVPVLKKDCDFEVFGISLDRVEEVLKKELDVPISLEGKAYQVLKVHKLIHGSPIDISVAREEVSTGKGHKDFIVTENPNLSLQDAAHRRDLSINALYYDPLERKLYDCFGGYEDVQQSRLDLINEERFIEDPLRVLRVMQFSSRFGFIPTERLVTTGERIVSDDMLAHLPIERVSEEFLKWAYHSSAPAVGLQYLCDIHALDFISTYLTKTLTTQQTHDWHPEGSVWIHTLQTVTAAADIAVREQLSPYEKAILLFASLLHDLGKTKTTEYVQEENEYRSYGHHLASEEIAKHVITRLHLPGYVMKSVPLLVRYHMQLHTLHENEKRGTDQLKAFMRLQRELQQTEVSMDMLLWLAEADMRARNPKGGIEPLKQEEVTEFLNIQHWTLNKQKQLTQTGETENDIISGRSILSTLDREEGPWVGAMKELVHDFVTDARVLKQYDRPELFDGEGKVQEAIITRLFNSADRYLAEHQGSWEQLAKDPIVRDSVIESVLTEPV